MLSQTPDSPPETAALDQMLVRLIIVAELLLNTSLKPNGVDALDADTDEGAPQKLASAQADV